MKSKFGSWCANLKRPMRGVGRVVGMMLMLGSVVAGPIALSGLAVLVPTPALATCIIDGKVRDDIGDQYCREAKRTGCVRDLLTPNQYRACLKANEDVRKTRGCVINGQPRPDIGMRYCAEAKETGCVRDLLTPRQYRACLAAQPGANQPNVCIINGKPRPDIAMQYCAEAKATGCVRDMLTPLQYRSCLAAQPR